MAVGDLITEDLQIEYGGVLLGNPTPYRIEEFDGLSMPDVRADSDQDRAQAHGDSPGQIWLPGRDIEVKINVRGGTAEECLELLTELAAVTAPVDHEEKPLVIQLPGIGKVRSNARVYRSHFPVGWRVAQKGYAEPRILWHASDPRLYDNEESSASASGGSEVGGLEYPHGFPHGFGTVEPGSISATNSGNFGTYPSAVVTVTDGSITSLRLTNTTTGEIFSMTLNMAVGDTMVLDFGARTAMLGGTASRVGAVDRPDSVWFGLVPGGNAIEFTYTGAGTASVELSWRSAWVL